MKLNRIGVIIFLLLVFTEANATHIAGGELFYERIGPGAAANSDRFKITMRLFRQCDATGGSGAALGIENPRIAIYNTFGLSLNTSIVLTAQFAGTPPQISNNPAANPCLTGSPSDVTSCYDFGTWIGEIELPQTAGGYTLVWSRYTRRQAGVQNVVAPADIGAAFVTKIPGANQLPINGFNSSPQFAVRDTAVVCFNSNFSLNYNATDPDGDSLAYKFAAAYDGVGGSSGNPDPFNNGGPPAVLNLIPLNYNPPYSVTNPLGPTVSLNVNTGIMSGTSPSTPGYYVICVMVEEWRNGIKINEHRKDFILKIGNCTSPKPGVGPDDRTCNGFNFTFSNTESNTGITGYTWTFGDGNSSTQPQPTHTYADTGVYKVTLKVTASGGCQDSASKFVYVFPGFNPNFNILDNCFQAPIRFQDATTTVYGVVNSWFWDFGDPTTNADTSRIRNPQYQYATPTTYNISLIANNSKGCIDTIVKPWVVVDKPAINLPFKDTLICSIDTLPLIVNTTGAITWTPNYNIINRTTANPLVYPKFTTHYVVTVNNSGCVNTDSIKVNVLDFITVDAGRDSAICLTDTVRLQTVSQALSYIWTSNTGEVVQPVKFPVVRPIVPTRYYVTANLGKCQDRDSINIRPVPYPSANAGNPVSICFGDNTVLNGSVVGSSFTWTPTASLINSNTLTPIARPTQTTSYILSANDTLGCPKPVKDTVVVTVIPKVKAFAGRDTSVVANQPLQLNASGATNYVWTPTTGLSDPFIANPIATLGPNIDSVRYIVTVSTPEGCDAVDDIVVKVFKTGPEIFVPTGFTPNGDGKNDILKPILVGMRQLEYFRIFNRWGQMIYQTSTIGAGWDGTIAGKQQQSGTYVFMAQAIDYLGNPVFKKGTVVLIR